MRPLLSGWLLLSASTLLLADEREEPKAPGVVSLRLELTVAEYDPVAPKGELKGFVKNLTDEPLDVPVAYDGERLVLASEGLTLWRRGEDFRPEKVETAPLAPGAERQVFSLRLSVLLVGDRTGEYRWTWPRRPAPPISPIHRPRGEGYPDQITFVLGRHAAGRRGTATFPLRGADVSEPVTLRVGRAEGPTDR